MIRSDLVRLPTKEWQKKSTKINKQICSRSSMKSFKQENSEKKVAPFERRECFVWVC